MVRYIGNGKVRNKEEALQFFERIIRRYKINENYGLKLLIDKTTGEKIGHAGLVPQMIEGKEYIEVGYWIDEKFWGKGYASEAAGALIKFGKEQLQLTELISLIQKGNVASERVAIKNGMKKSREILLGGKVVSIYKI